jgi:hypothetical protein
MLHIFNKVINFSENFSAEMEVHKIDPRAKKSIFRPGLELFHQFRHGCHGKAGLGIGHDPELVQLQLRNRSSESFRILLGGKDRDVEDFRRL